MSWAVAGRRMREEEEEERKTGTVGWGAGREDKTVSQDGTFAGCCPAAISPVFIFVCVCVSCFCGTEMFPLRVKLLLFRSLNSRLFGR